MAVPPGAPRKLVAPLFALAVMGGLYFLSQAPAITDQEADELASRFRFVRLPLPEVPGPPHKTVRELHPSLRHVSAFISFVGAAVALADLDGDGLPNDLVYVDPRTDQVIVAPVPGTGARYRPFCLGPAPLPFDPATMAPMGCLVGDFNEDGWPDILVYYWGRSPILFLQQPGSVETGAVTLTRERFFAHELVEPHQVWFTSAVSQADLDGDGHIDLIIGNYHHEGAHILDARGEGVEQMAHSLSHAYNGGRNRLLLWEGGADSKSVRFREVEGALEDRVARGWTFAIGAADLDGDLLPEIYFVKDYGPDRLLHNRSRPGKLDFAPLYGRRTFTTPRSKVLGRDSFNGMGIDFGDLNGDGVLDIFVSNITCRWGLMESSFVFLSKKNELHRMREGIAPYHDASEALGLARGGWTWEARLADFDNDGVLEAMQAAGYLKGKVSRWPELQEVGMANDELIIFPRIWNRTEPGDDIAGSDRNRFFVRASTGRYHDIASRLDGFSEPMCSRGIALADVDGDGRLDFAVANQWEPSFFFRNTAARPGAFLGLHLRLPVGGGRGGETVVVPGHPERKTHGLTRPAIGATATVHVPGGRPALVAQVDGGTGHSGKRAPDLHFGLGQVEPSTELRVDIRWRGPDGRIRSTTLMLKPGWYTVLLGEPTEAGEGDKR
jgi:hypothetical protein